ncbi:uncharacterized protein K02A2.6-like [Uranotaenia lowii]|uniref:uncharacterized protein K02A2.6-like n=1 Tax=Uranotaenia lowii TaxID=190385 RepID=UPI002479A793|nr:uncharacterized protein K02A2.6-like [Uranotaenia lowii]
MANNNAGNLLALIEPYRRGTSFSNWVERLRFCFQVNNISDIQRKPLLFTLSGPVVFDELMLLFPNDQLANAEYDDMIDRLKQRFDKKESSRILRFRFTTRVQEPNETLEDFILSLKMQAEFCNFGDAKSSMILDRIIAGVRDVNLRQRLLVEQNLTQEMAENLVATWEMAQTNAFAMGGQGPTSGIGRYGQVANLRGPVKSRLGNRPAIRGPYESRNYHQQEGFEGRQTRRYTGTIPKTTSENSSYQEDKRRKPDYRNTVCDFCKIKGHPKRKCFKLKNLKRKAVNFVDNLNPGCEKDLSELFNRMRPRVSDSDSDDSDTGSFQCMHLDSINGISDPCLLSVKIEGKFVQMEVDCGSSVTVMGINQFTALFDKKLKQIDKNLIVVNGSKLRIAGEAKVMVSFKNIETKLKIIVLDCSHSFIPLLGRNWLDIFYSDWRNFFTNSSLIQKVNLCSSDEVIKDVKQKFSNVFNKDFSSPIVGYEAELVINKEKPIFKKAYDVPYRLRDKVSEYLDNLQKQNVITPIENSKWASPIVIVMKKDNDIRLVIDCKVSINKVLVPNSYPLPVAQDLFAKLAGCKVFCSLDLEGAYTQLSLSARSRRYMVINTFKGLFTYNRLPQGSASSASQFQSVMDRVLEGLEKVFCYLDDVLIAGLNWEDCKQKLYLVLERLAKANIKIKLSKCKFFVEELIYLGHVISQNGLRPCSDKILTVQRAKAPTNVSELKSYLGLINFYNRFIPHLSSKLCYLYNLLKKDVKFVWDKNCESAFTKSKNALLSADILEFYDPNKPIVVVSDASGYGLGGVMAHIVGGFEKPICFTSFSLSTAQKKYPILHLEALALVCTIKKFHKYLYGQKFQVFTDHKPLVGIFGKDGQNSIYVTRLQRFILELSIYEFDIQYRPSAKMGNADFCSRFPLNQSVPDELDVEFIRSINFSKEIPIDFIQVATETQKDSFLSTIVYYMRNGWPKKVDQQLSGFFSNQKDLEIVNECLLYQGRVIIPQIFQSKVLKLLHANHAGIVKMKQLARCTIFWVGINKDIEKLAANCDICNSRAIIPKKKIESKWSPATRPFSRLHIDFFHYSSHTFLLIVDSFSKWLEVIWMKNGTDTGKVLLKLVECFSRFGLPDILVSDGGPPFNSHVFVNFLENQGIMVMKSPPYHPASNGQAERLVRTVKDVLKKFFLDSEFTQLNLEDQINLFLFNYRNFLTRDGKSPADKILSYKPKIMLDLINPKRHTKFQNNHALTNDVPNKVEVYPKRVVVDALDELAEGDEIWYENHNPHNPARWIKATFLKHFSSNTIQILVGNAKVMAHRRQVRATNMERQVLRPNVGTSSTGTTRTTISEIQNEPEERPQPVLPSRKRKQQESLANPGDTPELRRSKRAKKQNKDDIYSY